MSRFVKYIALSIFLLAALFLLSNMPIRKGYIEYKLINTQYEKLVWLAFQFENGKLKNSNFDLVVLGSSSALYGFNDSLTKKKVINLGVNTGCRAMELYLIESFINSGNKAKRLIKEYHILDAKYFDYYGLHPVLHYFVSSIWLLQHNQSFVQPHFLLFVLNRCRVVLQSWFYFYREGNYNFNYTQYGHRNKLGEISEIVYHRSITEAPFDGIDIGGNLKSWYHNYNCQKSYRIETDSVAKKYINSVSYVYFPTLNSLTSEDNGNENLKNIILDLKNKIGLELDLLNYGKEFVHNTSNWADAGHYSFTGSRIFSDSLIRHYSE